MWKRIAGLHYQGQADWVYMFFPKMKMVDILFGVFYLAVAAAAIVVRQQLAHFKVKAPQKLTMFYVISLLVGLGYPAVATMTVGVNCFDASVVGTIVGTVILLVVNNVYFKNREKLFCN